MHPFYEVHLLNSQVNRARCVFDNFSKRSVVCKCYEMFLASLSELPFRWEVLCNMLLLFAKKCRQIFTISIPLDSYNYLK